MRDQRAPAPKPAWHSMTALSGTARSKRKPTRGVTPVIRLKRRRAAWTVIDDRSTGRRALRSQINNWMTSSSCARTERRPITCRSSWTITTWPSPHVIRGDDHFHQCVSLRSIAPSAGPSQNSRPRAARHHGADGTRSRSGMARSASMPIAGWVICRRRCGTICCGSAGAMATRRSSLPAQAVEWFNLGAIGRAPARFDFAKLDNLNGHYIRAADDDRLAGLVAPALERMLGGQIDRDRLLRALPALKPRAKTLRELANGARFYVAPRPIALEDKAKALLDPAARTRLALLSSELAQAPWTTRDLEALVRRSSEIMGVPMGSIAPATLRCGAVRNSHLCRRSSR